jgi:hypothetical protein
VFFTGISSGKFNTQAGIGLGMFGGGLVSGAVGATMDKPSLSEEDAVRLARQYDDALRTHLGLGSESSRDSRTGRRFALAPAFTREFRGAALRLTF